MFVYQKKRISPPSIFILTKMKRLPMTGVTCALMVLLVKACSTTFPFVARKYSSMFVAAVGLTTMEVTL